MTIRPGLKSVRAGIAVGACMLTVQCFAQAVAQLPSSWRVTHSHPAPWCATGQGCNLAALKTGAVITLTRERLSGPEPLACEKSTFAIVRQPAEGLFEGGLPAPAIAAAQQVGVSALPAEVLRVTCANAGFDFVVADAQTLLLALDNRIWTLSGAPGALAADSSPEGCVQRLLEAHFAADMGFSPATVASKRDLLSAALHADITAWFAKPSDPNDVPEINGDPFTDTQEPPRRFAVQGAHGDDDVRLVPVRFADGWQQHELQYRLVREQGRWRVDDVLGRDGIGLRAILQH